MNTDECTTVAIYFWQPVCGNRYPVYVSSPNLYPTFQPKTALSRIVDRDEFAEWCSLRDIPFRNDGDFASIPFRDENERMEFKLRWWG